MWYRSEKLRRLLHKWPGARLFGAYRFLPLFFVLGAGLEYTMIHWDVNGKVNFYRTFKRNQAETLSDEIIRKEFNL